MEDNDLLKDQYESFPYPSMPEDGRGYPELANLMRLFALDCGYALRHKRVLDAGTGTGLRLLELARSFPDNDYLGVDFSERSIECAMAAKRAFPGAHVVFQVEDLGKIEAHGEPFDLIFCMGVLHHLKAPSQILDRLSQLLAPHGAIFFYVYGELGSAERMRRKRVLRHLHGDAELEQKVESAKQLKYTDFPYGWEVRSQSDIDAMIVDAYANHYEALYTLERIADVVPDSLPAWGPYGFTLERSGVLVESRLDPSSMLPVPRTIPRMKFNSSAIDDIYIRLPKQSQLLLLEDLYAPGGYTVMAHKGKFLETLQRPDRLIENAWH